jgi:hypothetical protein
MVDQGDARRRRVAHVVDLPAVLAHTVAHGLGQHGVVFDQQQVHGLFRFRKENLPMMRRGD